MGRARPNDINAWWKPLPGERYWLKVAHREDRDELLAAPRGEGRSATSWRHRLITHVREGDIVFRYDPAQRSITGWSSAYGRVEKQDLSWPLPAEHEGSESGSRRLPSWGIGLRQHVRLRTGVPLTEVARTQWELFPALRALEDTSEGSLYYPFEMGTRDITRPLAGYVFKLPAVFVQSFTEFVGAMEQTAGTHAVSGRSASPPAGPAWSRLATSR
jgi:hypothetical protein